jgi:hypothetical protein
MRRESWMAHLDRSRPPNQREASTSAFSSNLLREGEERSDGGAAWELSDGPSLILIRESRSRGSSKDRNQRDRGPRAPASAAPPPCRTSGRSRSVCAAGQRPTVILPRRSSGWARSLARLTRVQAGGKRAGGRRGWRGEIASVVWEEPEASCSTRGLLARSVVLRACTRSAHVRQASRAGERR